MLGRGLIDVVVVGRVAGYAWRRSLILTCVVMSWKSGDVWDQLVVLSIVVGRRREVLLLLMCCIGGVYCCRLWWKIVRLMLPGIERLVGISPIATVGMVELGVVACFLLADPAAQSNFLLAFWLATLDTMSG